MRRSVESAGRTAGEALVAEDEGSAASESEEMAGR